MLKDSTVGDLDDLQKKARAARSRLEPIWYLNSAYYAGEQWMAWDGRMLYRPAMPKNRITVVDNRIQGCVRTEIAKMTRSEPVFVVSPRTPDEMDVNASELGEQVLRYLWEQLHMHELSQKALLWSRICGAGFLKAFWDPNAGDKTEVLMGPAGKMLPDPQTGAPMRPDSEAGQAVKGMPNVVVKEIHRGEVRVEVRSPFQMFIDPLADTFDEAEWLIEESVKSAEYVKQRYGVELTPDTAANPGLVEARMGMVYLPGQSAYKGVKIREYWCKPNSEHPEGRRAVWATSGGDSSNNKSAKGTMLEENNAPFDAMPYVMLSGIPVPGRLWPTSIVEQLRGPQTELNKVKSQIAENRNRVGNPSLLASRQAIEDPETFTAAMTMPGGVHYFNDVGSPNAVPTFLQAPPLPDYVVTEIQRIEEAIQEISGQHEVTNAQVPPNVTAASAINLLQEADDTRLGPAIRDYEHQLGKLGQKVLNLVARYYTDARAIRLAGDNGAWEIFDFRGAMLRDNTQVEVQAGSAFPQSKAAKQAAMQELLTFFVQSGNPPQGRQLAQFLKDWEVGGADRLIEDYTVDETQCNRENMLLSQGQPLPINDYDNDQAHITAHTDFQKRQRYQQLPPQVKQIFEGHVQLHRQREMQMQQQQLQIQMQMQNGGQPQGQNGVPPEVAAQQSQEAHHQSMTGGYAEQGVQQAGAEQQQRHAEEKHQQGLRHAEEQHQVRLGSMAQQAQSQAQQTAAQIESTRQRAQRARQQQRKAK